ncbi:hypothetical protein [Fibrella aquatica]|jgi:hypothetical protein|uniref:hypothetical protein n=1 Tax=Fibrella aquatica TaxID=3242487 RepID=UPI00351FB918
MADYSPNTTWIGVGNKSGGIVMVAGIESVTGKLWRLDGSQSVSFSYTNARLGLGLGGTVGSAVLVAAFGCPDPATISRINTNDWSVAFSTGSNLAGILRGLPRYGQMLRLARILNSGLNRAVRVDVENLRSLGSVLYTHVDMATANNEPKLITVDLPYLSASVEISASYSLGTGQISVYP